MYHNTEAICAKLPNKRAPAQLAIPTFDWIGCISNIMLNPTMICLRCCVSGLYFPLQDIRMFFSDALSYPPSTLTCSD